MVDLATQADVENVLKRSLTPSEAAAVTGALAKASFLFRKESGQEFTPGTSEVRLKVGPASMLTRHAARFTGKVYSSNTIGVIYLKERPLVSLDDLTDDYGGAVAYELWDSWVFVDGLTPYDFVRATYTHGDAVVPPVVVQTVAEMVARSLSIPEQALGGAQAIQETTGPFTSQVQFARWASGGGVQLSPSDKEVARMFRVAVPKLWVGKMK